MKLPMYFSGKGPRLAVNAPWKTALKTLRSISMVRLAARNASCHESESARASAVRAAIKTMWATCRYQGCVSKSLFTCHLISGTAAIVRYRVTRLAIEDCKYLPLT